MPWLVLPGSSGGTTSARLRHAAELPTGLRCCAWLEVFGKVAGEMDAKIAEFDAALEKEMAKFDGLSR